MNIFRNPKNCIWVGRLVPGVMWVLWLVGILIFSFGSSDSSEMDILFVPFVLSLGAYLLWVYYFLPELIFKGNYKGIDKKVGYFLFTGFTAGLGPVILYFLRVEPVLRQMAAEQNK